MFGVLTDAAFYRAILDGRTDVFLDLLDRLAESLTENGVDFVASDAMEGFNPAHDICRVLVDAARVMVNRKIDKTFASYAFNLTGWEQDRPPTHDAACVHLPLDDESFRQKMAVARNYLPLSADVGHAINELGEDYFRIECLRKVGLASSRPASAKPYYEIVGEQRVGSGAYARPIRYEEHVKPLMQAIGAHAGAVSEGTRLGSPNI